MRNHGNKDYVDLLPFGPDSAEPNLSKELAQRPPKTLPTLGIRVYAELYNI